MWSILAGFEGGGFGPVFDFSFFWFCSSLFSIAAGRNFLDALRIGIPLRTAGWAEKTQGKTGPVVNSGSYSRRVDRLFRRIGWRWLNFKLRPAAKAEFTNERHFAGLKSSAPC